MKIVSLQVDNVKRIVCVSITPGADGHMVVIGGENAQGKTSLLDSIAMAIGGSSQVPAQPIRQGTSKASIVLQTEELIITRTFNKSGSQLVVTGPDKAKIASPQSLLDGLTNRVSFDPLAFTRMDAEKQAEALRRLVGIDFTELDKEYAGKYAERTGVNRELKTQQARVDGMNRFPDAPKELISVETLTAKLQAANTKNTENANTRERLVSLIDVIDSKVDAVDRARAALDQAKAVYAGAEKALEATTKQRDELNDVVSKLEDEDTAPILEEINGVAAQNEKLRANEAWKKEQESLVTKSREAQALTDRLAAIETEKEDALAKAKYPVEGLAFSSDGVTFDGVPFKQASAAEQLRVSTAMGFAMQPKLKVALIRDGSLLDDKSLAMVASIAQEHDGQVWIERVGDGAECSVILEAGEVSEDRTKKTK